MVILSCSNVLAAVWYVHPDSALNSIQSGLDSCSVGDTVLVASGTYYENLSWPLTDSILLDGEEGPDSTIIDGGDASRVVTISGISCAALRGFTIRNGFAFQGPGGGIHCHDLSGEFTLQDNVIMNNEAMDGRGGGISCQTVLVRMEDNMIKNNSADAGAGLFFAFASGVIRNTVIMQNTANDSGGGILCDYYSDPAFVSCMISENSPQGVFCHFWTSPTFDSCGIKLNYGDGIQFNYLHDAYVHNCDIAGNTGCGVRNLVDSIWVNAEQNWWGDSTGPFHPDSNPGGNGDSVSDYVDFIPWLVAPVGIELPEDREQRTEFSMKINAYPNPFSSTTTITLHSESEKRRNGETVIQIYDVSGRRVRGISLLLFSFSLGAKATWGGGDENGNALPPGVYFLKSGGKCLGKVVKVK
jgi:hypothetical protein